MVFQKFEQNVSAFTETVKYLALQFVVDEMVEDIVKDIPHDFTQLRAMMGADLDKFDFFITKLREKRKQIERFHGVRLNPDEINQRIRSVALLFRDNPEFIQTVGKVRPTRPQDIENAGAMIVGRYRTGEPVFVKTKGKKFANDFEYLTADKAGIQCPLHAHARRMNSRGEFQEKGRSNVDDPRRYSAEEPNYRIVRRGMPYGKVDESAWEKRHHYGEDGYTSSGNGDRGLLFMSFQADLENFEMLQQSANASEFYDPARTGQRGADPIIGESHRGPLKQTWPRISNPSKITKFPVRDTVTSKGGAYFFAPSLEFLLKIEQFSRYTKI